MEKEKGREHGKGHRRSAFLDGLISAAKRRTTVAEIFQNRAEKVLRPSDATHKHPGGNARRRKRETDGRGGGGGRQGRTPAW